MTAHKKQAPYPWQLDVPQVDDLMWCIHHNPRDGQAPLEILTDPIETRVDYIRNLKPAQEVETRLRAMRKARGPFPLEIQQAYAAREQAIAAYQQADAAWEQAIAAWKQAYVAWEQADATRKQSNAAREQACAAWEQVLNDHEPELMELFRSECPDVAWGPDGLFSKR